MIVYEEEPYLHTYLSRRLQAIQLFRPTRGVATTTPGYRQGKRTFVKKLTIGTTPGPVASAAYVRRICPLVLDTTADR